jgi:hypothetical protein
VAQRSPHSTVFDANILCKVKDEITDFKIENLDNESFAEVIPPLMLAPPSRRCMNIVFAAAIRENSVELH